MDDREQADTPGPAGENEPEEPSIVDGEEHPVDSRSVKVARMIAIPVILLIALAPLAFITIGWALGGIPTMVYLRLIWIDLSSDLGLPASGPSLL